MASIKIETGLKVYDIEDEHGNIRGQISFNPSDINFFTRADEAKVKIFNIITDFSKLSESDSEEEKIQGIRMQDKAIKDEINKLFDDDNASNVVFGNQNSLNTLKGVTFIERFMDAFMPIIKSEFDKENKNKIKRIEKYTKQVK